MTVARTPITPMPSTTTLGKEMIRDREDLSVGASQIAQAMEFVRALREHLLKMTRQLAWIERQDVTGRNARAYAMRIEAAALRRDINEAEVLIDRLQRGYLNDNRRNGHHRRRAAFGGGDTVVP